MSKEANLFYLSAKKHSVILSLESILAMSLIKSKLKLYYTSLNDSSICF